MDRDTGAIAPDARFLRATPIIDWDHPAVRDLAGRLAEGNESRLDVARSCFEWVRDRIPHTSDHGLDPVTRSASEVLAAGTGFCYAKAHLLAALLRANGVPAGFSYQRLRTEGPESPTCLHGLNAIWLEGLGWRRIDARGARPGLRSEFAPPEEVLPFAADGPGERTFPGVWADPAPVVLAALADYPDRLSFLNHLPDAEDLGPSDAVIGDVQDATTP